MLGTPDSLLGAVQLAAKQINEMADEERITNTEIMILKIILRDYLAKRIGRVTLDPPTDPDKLLEALWAIIE